MAEEELTEEDGEEGSGGKGKLIILIVVGVVLIAASIGGTLFFLGFFDDKPEAAEGAAVEETAAASGGNPSDPAIYFPLAPPLVVNYEARGRQRFVQAQISVMSREQDVIDAVQLHMPAVRNALVMLFGGQEFEELQTPEGKEMLRQRSLESLQEIMQRELGRPGIEQVLFTNFVMQ